MRIDVQITGVPEERAEVEARSALFCEQHPDARVRARIVETVADRLPKFGTPGQVQCQRCGQWHDAGPHECLSHGSA